jgi:hypothetical protein
MDWKIVCFNHVQILRVPVRTSIFPYFINSYNIEIALLVPQCNFCHYEGDIIVLG